MQQLNSDYLSFLEKRELLEKYRSDLRKVEFERDYLLSLISRLEDELRQREHRPPNMLMHTYSNNARNCLSY